MPDLSESRLTTQPGFAASEVRQHNGVPTLFVNGVPLHGMTATSVSFNAPDVVDDFVRGGVELLMIWIEIGLKCWKGPGQYDWTYAEEKLTYFEQHGGDTKWIIRVRLGLVAEWYRHVNPTEVHNPPGGSEGPTSMSTAVIASSVWCAHVCEVISAFVSWLKTTRWAGRIVGFMLNAGSSEEWLIFDTPKTTRGEYHAVYTREFRAWLRKRYKDDVEAMRSCWHDAAVDFDSARPPVGMIRSGSHIWGPFTLRDPAIDRPAIDYYYFLNETLADHMIAICRSAKEAAGTPIICGGFHSYLWWETGVYSYIQEYGHALVQRVVASPYVDFVSDITSYDNRYPGGPSGYLGLPHCLNLHNKLHYTEVDIATMSMMEPKWLEAWQGADVEATRPGSAEPAIPDSLWKWRYAHCGRDADEQVAILQREHMHNVITGTPYWWFDIKKRSFQPEPLVKAMAKLSGIGKRAVQLDRRSISEVAFVCSEDTPMYQSAMNGSLIRFEMEHAHTLLLDLSARGWGTAGVPFDVYELHDLAAPNFPGEQYKLIIFVNCGFISPAAAAGIRRWQNNGRVMCWTFAAGVLNETQINPALSADLIGIRLGWRKQRRNIHVMVDDTAHPLASGGSSLNFGVEGSIGPVMFVDDPAATPLGRLRDGGEVGFALREHADWKSVYLSMHNFGPAMMRNLTRFAGGHVWCETDDVLYANQSLLCLHTARGGRKSIRLPHRATVTDLWTGERVASGTNQIDLELPAYRTRMWQITPEAGQ